jgi:putative endopeptidase
MSLTRRKPKYTKNFTRRYKLQSDSGVGDNFYSAVNKSWLDKAKIPPTKVAYGVSEEIEKKIEVDSKKLIDDCIRQAKQSGKKSYKESLEALVGNLALSVRKANTTQVNLSLVKNVLSSIETASNKEEIAVILGEFCKYKIHCLFHLYAQYENTNHSKYTFTIGNGTLGLPDPSYYFEKSLNRSLYYQKYKQFLKRLGKLFNIPTLHCVVKLERILAGVLLESQNDTLKVAKTGADLQKEFQHIPWEIFF